MLEILFIVFLCNKNKSIVNARGRKSGLFSALTAILWFGGEILGAIAGFMVFNDRIYEASLYTDWDTAFNSYYMPIYIIALICAAAGGLIAYLIAKNCKPGDYVAVGMAPLPNAQPLPEAVPLHIVRDKSFVGMAVAYTLLLNGQEIGQIRNGGSLMAYTQYAHNTLVIRDVYGSLSIPFCFTVYQTAPGQAPEVHMKANKILPQKCVNCVPIDPRAIQSAQQQASHTNS